MKYSIISFANSQPSDLLAGSVVAGRNLWVRCSPYLSCLPLFSCFTPVPALAGGLLKGWSEGEKENLFLAGMLVCVIVLVAMMLYALRDTLRMLDDLNKEVDFLSNSSAEVRNLTPVHQFDGNAFSWLKCGTRKGEAGYVPPGKLKDDLKGAADD